MKFGRISLAEAHGAVLAHAIKKAGLSLKKGEVLRADDVARLRSVGIDSVVAARLEPGDVGENDAARALAVRLAGANVKLERPFTGRCNLIAAAPGLARIEARTIDAINEIDESLTIATVPPWQILGKGDMIATVKIIPFAVPSSLLDRAVAAAARPSVGLAAFSPRRVAVISTVLPGLKTSVVDKTLRVLDDRLRPAQAEIVSDLRIAHDAKLLAAAIHSLPAADLIVVFGASAITDRRDIIPTAIEQAGGEIEQLGMPVDPGNLLLLARLVKGGRTIPIIGAPGCARSPKINGFDFVLWRLLAGESLTRRDLRAMGVGGLLTEIEARPQRRQAPHDNEVPTAVSGPARPIEMTSDG